MIRLDKFLSDASLGTRKHVKTLIRHGAIKVDDQIITDPGYLFDPKIKKVFNQDKLIPYFEELFFLLNKPQNFMCSTIDEAYPSVLNLLPLEFRKRLQIVGRLDADTTGVLLLTSDGKLNNYLAHPKNNIGKVYRATTNHPIPESMIEGVKSPLPIGRDEYSSPAELKIIASDQAEITLHEGKYHEVKRIFKRFDLEVIKLDRISFDKFTYGDLKPGEYRQLQEEEVVEYLKIIHKN